MTAPNKSVLLDGYDEYLKLRRAAGEQQLNDLPADTWVVLGPGIKWGEIQHLRARAHAHQKTKNPTPETYIPSTPMPAAW